MKNGTKIYTRGPALKNIKKLMVLCLAAVVCCGLYDTRVEAAGAMWNAPIFSRLLLTTGIVGKEIEGDEDDDIKIRLMAVDETKQDCIWADTDEEVAVMWSNEDVEVKIDVQSKSDIKTISYRVDGGNEIIVDCSGEDEELTMVISEGATDDKGVPVEIVAIDVDDRIGTYNGWVRVDKEAPVVGEITYAGETGDVTRGYGNIYSNEMIRVSILFAEAQSGIDEKSLKIVFVDDAKKTEAELDVIPEEDGRYCTSIPAQAYDGVYDGYIRISVADVAGNTAEEMSERIIYSQRKPVISIDGGMEYGDWTNRDVKLHVRAETGNGIKKVTMYVAGEKVLEEKPDTQLTVYEHDLLVKASAKKYTGYVVEVRVVDNCGNESKRKQRVFIDKEMPKIDITGVGDGDYASENVSVSVAVSDVSFSNTIVEYVIVRALNGKSYEEKRPAFTPREYEDKDQLMFSQEGKYTIYAVATDGAGNVTESERLHFCIDKTVPETAITGVAEGEARNRDVRVKFICEENNYDTTAVYVKVKRTVDGMSNITEPEIFEHDRRVEVRDYVFSEEGEYEISLLARDKAGNESPEEVKHFTIDKTKPEVVITGTSPYQQWDKAVELKFVIKEEHIEEDKVIIKGVRTDINGRETELVMPEMTMEDNDTGVKNSTGNDGRENVGGENDGRKNGGGENGGGENDGGENNGVENDGGENDDGENEGEKENGEGRKREAKNGGFAAEFREDGMYRLSVSVKDSAGNKTSKTIHFLIDTTAPEITGIDQYDGMYYRIFEPENVTDNLFKDLTLKHCALYLNGLEYDGVTPVTEEGKYILRAEASDELGHKSEAAAQFIVDHTAPKVTFTGVTDGEVVDREGEVAWETEDRDDHIEKVVVNGKDYDVNLQNISYNTFGTYNIEVTGADRAGNRSVSSIRFEYVRPLEKFMGRKDAGSGNDKRQPDAVMQQSGDSRGNVAAAIGVILLAGGVVMAVTVYMYRRKAS